MAIGTQDLAGDRTFWAGIPGVNDNDIVIETETLGKYDTFMLLSTAGAMDVYVTLDGTNYTTAPLSLADLGGVSSDPVLVTVAGRMYGFRGTYKKIRVRQNGAVAVANPTLACRDSSA